MGRGSVNGIGQGLHGDLTTTGAVCISSLPNARQGSRGVLRLGDKTTPCPLCGKIGVIVDSLPAMRWMGIATVLDGAEIYCGCPTGRNRLIAPVGQSSRTHLATQPSTVASSAKFASAQESSVAIPHQLPALFAQSFAITDSNTGLPLTNRTYIAMVDGQRTVGLTDANGIAIVKALTAHAVIKLHVMFQAPARELIEFSEATV